jgi:hypothetical protein
MGITVTREAGLDDFTVNGLASRNFVIVPGTIDYSSASATALAIDGSDIGMSKILGLFVSGKTNLQFSVASSSANCFTVQPMAVVGSVSTSMSYIIATVSASFDAVTGIPFLAWGYR